MIRSYFSYIRSFFLPESINGYYISPQIIVGLEIQSTKILATTVYAQGNKRTITGCYQEDIPQDELLSLEERQTAALKKISGMIGHYNALIISLSNNIAVFKEVTVPFTNIDTIKMVIPFEVEPTLPFALSEALIDILVIHQDKVSRNTTVQVAIVKQADVRALASMLENAELKPTKFSLHLFEFYSIFKEIPEYHSDNTSTLCIETTQDSRQFIAIVDGELKNVRIIPRGYNDSRFLRDIQFTLDTFNNVLPESKKIKKILVATTATDNKTIITEIQDATDIKTEEFLLYKVVHNNSIKAVNSALLTTPFIASVGAALDLPYTRNINFLQQDLAPRNNSLLLRQFIMAATLLFIILGSILAHTQRTQYKIKKEILSSQEETKSRLIKELGLPKQQVAGRSLDKIIDISRTYITKQEEIWFALSSQNRYSFLNYLQELFRRLNAKALGLTITMLSINDSTDTMILEGEVRDYTALQLLDQELSRPNSLFKEVTHPQDPKFSIKIMLDKNYKED